MRISDWSSDVCSSDLPRMPGRGAWCQPIACVARSIMFRLRCHDVGIFPLTASAPHEELLNHHEEQRDEENAEHGAYDHSTDNAGTEPDLGAGASPSFHHPLQPTHPTSQPRPTYL